MKNKRKDIDPYGEETWDDNFWSRWKIKNQNYCHYIKDVVTTFKYFLYVSGSILLVIALIYGASEGMKYFRNSDKNKVVSICEKQYENFKIRYSEYYKKYAVEDVEMTKLLGKPHFLYKSCDKYYVFRQSIQEPTMFDDSCEAKQFIVDYENYLIDSKRIEEDKKFK